jgi:hypothetical protein
MSNNPEALRILPSEILQVQERIRGERLPLFVIQVNERNEKIAKMWRIPGTSVRVSPEGDIFYPIWKERDRVLKPELYAPCSDLPRGWSLERLLKSQRRPISEVVFHQVQKEEGGVDTAIRAMDHVLEKYKNRGKELAQIKQVEAQINQALKVLQETKAVSHEEFERGFEILYRQTLELLEISGMSRAASALKKDIARLLEEASTGKDRLGRRNPTAMLKKLEAAARRVSFRRNEADFIVAKFEAMKAGLIGVKEHDLRIISNLRHEMEVGLAAHQAFKFPEEKTTDRQRGILVGKIGSLIYQLEQVKVKPYKPVAVEAIRKLKEAQRLVREGDYQKAKEIFQGVLDSVRSLSFDIKNSP